MWKSIEYYPPRAMKTIPTEETRQIVAAAQQKVEYYQVGGVETIDFIRAKLTKEQFIGYCLGNVMKYSSRLNYKGDPKRDAKKLEDYSKWLEDSLNGT